MNKNTKKNTMWTISNLIFYAGTVLVNYMGAAGFFNNMSQKDISNKYHTLITPSGFTFSIWGLIYGLLLATVVYLFIKRNDQKVDTLIKIISPLFIISCVLNIAWIIVFSYEMLALSFIIILAILISLMMIIEKLCVYRKNIMHNIPSITFTFYASWLFIASIVNVSAFLVQKQWDGFGLSASLWTIIILCIAILLVVLYSFIFKNALFIFSVAWAFFGIYMAYKSGELQAPMSSSIKIILIAGITIYILTSFLVFIKNKKSIFPGKK